MKHTRQSYITRSFVKHGLIQEGEELPMSNYEGPPLEVEITEKDWAGSMVMDCCYCVGGVACARIFPNAKAVAFGFNVGWALTHDKELIKFIHTGKKVAVSLDEGIKPVGMKFKIQKVPAGLRVGAQPNVWNLPRPEAGKRGEQGHYVKMRRMVSNNKKAA